MHYVSVSVGVGAENVTVGHYIPALAVKGLEKFKKLRILAVKAALYPLGLLPQGKYIHLVIMGAAGRIGSHVLA